MSTARPFAYNTGSTIPGTEQLGDLSIGTPTSGFTTNPQYWNGPDEELGYIIAQSVPDNSQPTPIDGVFASVGFYRSEFLTEISFVDLTNSLFGQSFVDGANAKIWLNDNGYWTSYGGITPTPTPTSQPVWYQILDCNDSSVGYSIAYTSGAFSVNEKCTAQNVTTRTVIVIGSTTTLPGGPLYTLTSLGVSGCNSTPLPTRTPTPTPTPVITYPYLGRTAVDGGNSGDACSNYLTVRPYYSLKSSLSSIVVGDRFYDSYPLNPTNGGNNWVALKSSGVGTAYSFQIDTSGYVIQLGGACP